MAIGSALTPFPEPTASTHDDHPRLALTVLTVLERERKILIDQLASVRAKDYAEYLGRFSQIDGLNIAISHVKEQAKKLG